MSYDLEFTVDAGDPRGPYNIQTGEYFNITYNVRPIFQEAFRSEDGIRFLDGKKGIDIMKELDEAIRDMEIFPYKYERIAAETKRSRYVSTLDFLRKVRKTVGEFPYAAIKIY